jgi:hypothetical protein
MGNTVPNSSNGQSDRRRVAQACKPCSITKVRCDGSRPCHRCTKHGQECYYEPAAKRKQSIPVNPGNDSLSRASPPKRAKSTDHLLEMQANIAPATITARFGSEGQLLRDTIHPTEKDPSALELAILDNQTQSASFDLLPMVNQPPTMAISDPQDTASAGGAISWSQDEWNTMISTPAFSFGEPLDVESWLNFDIDISMLPPDSFTDPALEVFSNKWSASLGPKSLPRLFAPPTQSSPIARLLSRAHSPTIDKDNLAPREYVPTSIDVDAQLRFPDMEQFPMHEIEQENLAHVDEITSGVVTKVAEYTALLDLNGPYPAFLEFRIPPTQVLNSWVQLYFEHFHPVFPILHQPSFSKSDPHWLLVFTVAALGAHFSNLKGAQICSRAMHELIRRHASSMVSWRDERSFLRRG